MVHELQHHIFQFTFSHLPVPHDNPRLRNQRLQLRRNLPDALHAIVDEINLPAALQFLLQRRLNQFFIPARDHGLNRHAIFGRRFNHAHVAQSHQRHVQRARNRCRRHGQHVHLFAHLLDAFFVPHAETLFFVHNQQSEIGKFQILRQQAVRADQNVDLPGLRLLQNFFLLFRIDGSG